MKILMVLDHEFPPDTRVENEIVALINGGHEVHLACFTQKNCEPEDNFKGAYIHRIPVSKLIYKSSVAALTFPTYFRFWEKFLNRLVAANSIEVIHIHDLPLAEVGRRVSKRFGLKLVVDLHENWPALLRVSTHTKGLLGKLLSPNHLWVRYEKKILHSADIVIVVVDESKKRLESIGIEGSKIVVVSNTLNEEEFNLSNELPDPKYFTLYYAGGINFHRGIQTVIKALPFIKKEIPNIRFRIAGSGSYLPQIQQLVSQLQLHEHVEFLGHLSLAGVAENLSKADAAIIPHNKSDHTDSTIPHKLFQYMYANKPIVASNCAPIERIVAETSSGVIYRWDSPEDLAEKLINLAKGKIRIEAARKWVESKYRWKVDAATLINSYNRISRK